MTAVSLTGVQRDFPVLGGVVDLALPATNQLAWWYAGNGATIPVEVTTTGDGQAITAVADMNTTDVDLTKAGAGTVTYRKAVSQFNQRGAFEFDGSSYLSRTIAAGIAATLSAYTLYVVFRATVTTANMSLYCEANNPTTNPLVWAALNRTSAGNLQYTHRDDAGTIAAPLTAGLALNDGVAHLLTLSRTAANAFSLRIDGVERATATEAPSATTTINRLALGALLRNTASSLFTGQIATAAVYNVENVATIEPLLAAHYDITLP